MTTLDVGTSSLHDVRKVVTALGGVIADESPTEGACGYTTITIATTPLPRDEDGEIVTSAEFGESYLVRIEWNTDFDGRAIDPGKEEYPASYYGPFLSEDEAVEWMNAYPEDTDVYDMTSIVCNNVRPTHPKENA